MIIDPCWRPPFPPKIPLFDTKVFSSIGVGGGPLGPGGAPQAPLWSLVNIKCVAANIMCGVANILRGSAYILHGTLGIYFEQCLTFCMSNTKFLGVFKRKNKLFSNVLKIWSSCQKTDYHFLGLTVQAVLCFHSSAISFCYIFIKAIWAI